MNKNVTSDAVSLASTILRGMSSDRKWKIVNIAKDSRRKFEIEGYIAIRETYGYEFDDTVGFLERNKVVESKVPGWWYVDIVKTDSYWATQIYPNITILDDNWWKAKEKRYLKDDELPEYYFEEKPSLNQVDCQGPRMNGQFSVLVNKAKLKEFINKFREYLPSSDSPIYHDSSDEVWYKDFKFNEKRNSLSLPPFGECEFSKKNNPKGTKQNQRAFLVKMVVEAGEVGITASSIRKEFDKNTYTTPDNRKIDAMIIALNNRFKNAFSDADVTIKNTGSNGSKRIKLSVMPRQKT